MLKKKDNRKCEYLGRGCDRDRERELENKIFFLGIGLTCARARSQVE